MSNRSSSALSELGFAYATVGRRAEAIAFLKELETRYEGKEAEKLEARYDRRGTTGTHFALIYLGLGEKDKVFEWIERDFQSKAYDLAVTRWESNWAPIRNDPRYISLLKRMGLPVQD